MSATAWTPEQVKLAFHLYCQLPFGRLHHSNPEIIALANLIGRTPSAVAMKLVNLASLDPIIVASGRKGLSGASRLDPTVWDEFHTNWEGLVREADRIREALGDTAAIAAPQDDDPLPDFTGQTRAQIVQQRIRQSFFRRTVLASYHSRCCITGLAEPRLLLA